MLIVNEFPVAVNTSNVFVVKLAVEKLVAPPPGKVTEVNVKYSPANKPCDALFTVTVEEFCVEVKVQPVIAVSNGVMS
jgi:hypothetical protein